MQVGMRRTDPAAYWETIRRECTSPTGIEQLYAHTRSLIELQAICSQIAAAVNTAKQEGLIVRPRLHHVILVVCTYPTQDNARAADEATLPDCADYPIQARSHEHNKTS